MYENSKNIHFIGWGREIITNKDKVQNNFQDIYCHKFKKITDVKIVYIESTVHNLRKIELGIPCVVFR